MSKRDKSAGQPWLNLSIRPTGTANSAYSDGDIYVSLSDTATPAARDFLDQQIKRFNDAASPHHRQIRPVGTRPLDVLVYDANGEVIGGLVGETYWDWLEVVDLWLSDRLRSQGIGRLLMQLAEQEAQNRGCQRALVRTFSFQARGFYERLGYQVVGRLDDYPPGESFFWLRKDFSTLEEL